MTQDPVRHHDFAQVEGVRIGYTRAGDGPLLVLLHGWPQTRRCWDLVIDDLARDHTVVAADLRGYGTSDKPGHGYDKRQMAADMAGLVEHLGFDSATVIGHDRGARVGHRWALDRPDQVSRLVVLDVVPTREMFRRLDATVAAGYWHWLFHMQHDLPERLVSPDVRGYLEYFFERWTYNRDALPPEAVDDYVRAFSRPGALRAGFDDYRAQDVDLAHDEEDATAGRRVTAPLLALWGSVGLPARLPTLDIWREYAEDVTGTAIERCGHFVPEERPEELLRHLRAFLTARGDSPLTGS
ncbi:alpha/beta hydrolase [Spiractinospora alimapuensis]|uniref:alpha/beta fold hydrolase n=1 Tax=Spiractinospora alimapuensis TaxID=2820884 RepID=UPI001F167803|nr:alpha/beta hydrolase [Spiractinospora alimapuensis]QVQ52621.1 alpha/beta hydrolase [Spiractinospora alimapuensis]